VPGGNFFRILYAKLKHGTYYEGADCKAIARMPPLQSSRSAQSWAWAGPCCSQPLEIQKREKRMAESARVLTNFYTEFSKEM
jgi:hypothetical protein